MKTKIEKQLQPYHSPRLQTLIMAFTTLIQFKKKAKSVVIIFKNQKVQLISVAVMASKG